MRWLTRLWRNLVQRERVERDLDDELRATFEALLAEKRAQGLAEGEARRAARLELGGVESIKAQVRDVRAGAWLDTFLQDVRYAARLLLRHPLFAVTAALSLAVGIGATTAIFTIANGLLLRAAAGVPEPARLVDLARRPPGFEPGLELLSYPDLVDVRERTTLFDEVFGYQFILHPSSLRAGDTTAAFYPTLVTTNYFRALGVRPLAGRVFDDGDSEQAGAGAVIVLSHRFWMRHFSGSAAAVGQTVRVNNVPVTIVGVAPEGFAGLTVAAPDAWLPVGMITALSPEGKGIELTKRIPWLAGGARLKPGVTRAQASAQVAVVGAAIQRTSEGNPFVPPGARERDPSTLIWSAESSSPIPYGMRTVAAGFIGLLGAVVSIVLVIACANLAGVLLARATSRRREIAVRTAVGAARARLVRQLLTETVLLFSLGAAAGLLLARRLTTLLLALLPAFPIPVALPAPLDGRVVLFALALSFVSAVLSGLAPALHASRSDVVSALKDDTQGPVDRHRLRNAFVVAQVAFSILLVVVAALLIRGFDNVMARQSGIDPRGVDLVSADLSMAGYTPSTGPAAIERLLARARAIPGVLSATIADRSPQDGGNRVMGAVAGPGGVTDANQLQFNWYLTAPGYFDTLGIRLVAGRDFTAADSAGAAPVAIVGERTARQLWPGRDALGQQLQIMPTLFDPSKPREAQLVQVVGVAEDRTASGSLPLYVPIGQRYLSTVTVMTRRAPDDPSLAAALAAVVEDDGLPVLTSGPLERVGDGPVQTQLRIAATVAGSVGVVGLLLAAIGIYGVTAYAVTQRTREIGIRLSLGARPREVVALVLKQGMTLVAVGSAIGLALGVGAGRLLAGRRFGLPQSDPVALAVAAVLFVIVGLVACYVPVRRAARIRAMEALRYE